MPVSAEAAGLPPATTSTSGTPGAAATPAEATAENKVEEPKKKRGFWSRVFGRGGEDEDKKKEEERKKAEERRRKGG